MWPSPRCAELHTAITDVDDVALGDEPIGGSQRHAIVFVARFVAVEAAQTRAQLSLVVEQHAGQVAVAPQLQIGRHVRALVGHAAGALDESLIAEDVVEMPVAVDDPADGTTERAQVIEEFVGLAQIGTRVDDEQRVSTPYDTDVQVEGWISPSEAAITHLVPEHHEDSRTS